MTLGSYGVETLVVERRKSPSTLPRATAASTGTMELLRRWGLEEAARGRAIDVEWQASACPTLAAAAMGEAVEVGAPDARAGGARQPDPPACLPQDELEPLLEERLGSFASTRARARGRAPALAGKRRRPRAHACRSGGRRQVRARYLIGADGIRSKVREELGIASEGSETVAERLGGPLPRAALGTRRRAPLRDLLHHRRSRGPQLPAGGQPDRWAFGGRVGQRGRDVGSLTSEQIEEWIREAAGVPACRSRSSVDAGRLRRRARRTIPRGRRVPDRRRRSPGDTARRHRAEHRDPRRLRHRLEARVGLARLGGRGCSGPTSASAGLSRNTTRSARFARTGRSWATPSG